MSHSFVVNHLHIVFSTKQREKLIRPAIEKEVWGYLGGIAKNHDMEVRGIGGTEDHVHLLLRIPADMTVAKAVNVLKSNSSKWLRRRSAFRWQVGYGAFSVSNSNLKTVAEYVRNQKQHHSKRSFEQEFLSLLRKHDVEFELETVFD